MKIFQTKIFRKHVDKLLFAVALVVLAAAMLDKGSGRSFSKRESLRIVFTQWRDKDLEKETLQDLIDEFVVTHEGIKIIFEDKPYEEVRNALFDAAAASPVEDILALDPLWLPELQRRGIIENPQTEIQVQQIYKTPLLSYINVLYYNVELLKEAGFSRPPKNRTEFITCLRAIIGKNKNRDGFDSFQGLALGRSLYDDFFPWIWAAGAELIKDEKPALTSRQFVDGLSFFLLLKNEGFISPDAFFTNSEKKLEAFISGKAAFMVAPSGYIGLIREYMGEEAFSVSSIPIPDNYVGKYYFGSPGWTLGINAASANKKEARLFADFLAARISVLSEKAGAMPVNGLQPAWDPLYSKVWDIAIAGESSKDFTGLPWIELESIFMEELNSLFAKKSSPAKTAAAIQKKWEEVLPGFAQ